MARTLFVSKNRGFGARGGGSDFSTAERDRFYFRRRLGVAGFVVLIAFGGLPLLAVLFGLVPLSIAVAGIEKARAR